MTGQCVLSIGQKSLLFNRQFLITQSSIIYTHPSTRHFFNKRHSPSLSLHLCAQKMAMEMAIRSSFTTRLSPRSTSSTTKPSFFKPHQLRPISVSLPTSTISLLSLFAPPNEAKALTISKDQVVSTLTDVEKTIDQAVEFSSSVLDSAQKVFEGVTNSLKPGIDVALPIAKQAGEQAVKIASPAISEASKKAQEAIQSTGIDTEPVLSAAKTLVGAAQQTTKVIEEAKPIASSTVETITSADPVVIVGAAGAVFLAYLLFPSIWSAVSFGLRGYKGEITPAQVLDLLSTKNYIMIDIRSEKDKEKAGIPRLPSSAKNQMVSVPLEELPSKLKGIVRNVKKLEAELAALKISYLKKINKGSNIVIMDSYSDSAKIVARVLTSLGFNNCWTVSGGFSGGRGWLQSWLGADSYNVSFTEVLRPSRIIPAAAGRVGTASSKLLPGGD